MILLGGVNCEKDWRSNSGRQGVVIKLLKHNFEGTINTFFTYWLIKLTSKNSSRSVTKVAKNRMHENNSPRPNLGRKWGRKKMK
jgi:hypothetical protein